MKITNTQEVRIFNSITTLNAIRAHSPISRADLSVTTGLNKATVSTIVRTLLSLGLIGEMEQWRKERKE